MTKKINKKFKKLFRNFKSFSLVELIIVIAIIAILSVAGFMTLTKWIGKSRDSRRISDLETIKKSLTVNRLDMDTSEDYPMPDPDDSGKLLTGEINGQKLAYRGTFGSGVVKELSSLTKTSKDPSGERYAYGITKDKKKFEIAAVLEGGEEVSYNFTDKIYAGEKYSVVKGNYDGAIVYTSGDNRKYIANVPSLIYNFSGEISLIDTGNIVYIVNKGRNLAYGEGYESINENFEEVLKKRYNLPESTTGLTVVNTGVEELGNSLENNSISTGVIDSLGGSKGFVEKKLEEGGVSVDSTDEDNTPAVWYDSNWNYRKKITIQHEQVSGDLTDFPVYVDLSDMGSDFFDNMGNTDCGDIRVTTGDKQSEIPREVVSCDIGNNKGELHFKAPELSDSSDTEFYIYYGNSSASDYSGSSTYGAENVWDENYEAVYHMNDINDSTSNVNNCTNNGVSFIQGKTTKVGFFGGSSKLNCGDDNFRMGGNDFTLGLWMKTSTPNIILNKDKDGNGYRFGPNTDFHGSNKGVMFRIRDNNGDHSGVKSDKTYADNNRHYIVGTREGNDAANRDLMIDGILNSEIYANQGTQNSDDNCNLYIGWEEKLNQYFEGKIDEVRISKVVRYSNWILTSYNNQNSPATFITVGSQEEY